MIEKDQTNQHRTQDDIPTTHQPAYPGTPHWVKWLGGVVLILFLMVMLHLLSGGTHGPGRHGLPGNHPSPTLVQGTPQP